MIGYGRQTIGSDDENAVLEVLRSDYLTQGPIAEEFERELASFCGVKHAVVVNSATSALHLAYLALGLTKGDLVWTTPNTFCATANAALFCGADIDFVDVDPVSLNIDVALLAEKLWAVSKSGGRLPKVLAVVHFSGRPVDLLELEHVTSKYGIKVIEDASHALGAKYHGSEIGSCKYSECVVSSFHPLKMITTGEGGVLLTNNSAIDSCCRLLRSHGITKNPGEFLRNPFGHGYHEQQFLGFNYRMSDIQAALGSSQLKKVKEFSSKRNQIAARYVTALKEVRGVVLPLLSSNDQFCSFHLFVIKVLEGKRDDLANYLYEFGYSTQVHYIPVYWHPYYVSLGFVKGLCPNAESAYDQVLSLPIYPSLADESIDDISAKVIEFMT